MKDTIKHTYLAADFGGGSGRIIAGFLHHGKLELEEVYRFCNRQVKLGNHIYWDFPALFEDMKTGLKLAAQKGYAVKGIGIDTWKPIGKSCLLSGCKNRRNTGRSIQAIG